MWRRPPRGARRVARWWRADAPRGGHRVEPDVGGEPPIRPSRCWRVCVGGKRARVRGAWTRSARAGPGCRTGGDDSSSSSSSSTSSGGKTPPPQGPQTPPQGPQRKNPATSRVATKKSPPPQARAQGQSRGQGQGQSHPSPPQTPAPPYARKGPGPLWECAGCGGHRACPLGGGGQLGDRQPNDGVGGLG